MTDQTTTIPTPAKDALEAAREGLEERIRIYRESAAADLSTYKREALVEKASSWMVAPHRETKGTLVALLAQRESEETVEGKRLEALRAAASDERRILAAIEKAPKEVEAARIKVIGAATPSSTYWSPETALDAAVDWQVAKTVAWCWHSVAVVAAKENGSPAKALDEVVAYVTAETLDSAGTGSTRSTSATRNLVHEADQKARFRFLREAARYSEKAATIVRW